MTFNAFALYYLKGKINFVTVEFAFLCSSI